MAKYRSSKHSVSTESKVILKKRITFARVGILRAKLLKKQNNICPVCLRDIKKMRLIATLDHCHSTGYVRGVLCNNCNGLEGKLTNVLQRIDVGKIGFDQLLQNLANYRHPSTLKKKFIHPNVETLREKRDRQNARARKLYQDKKELEHGKLKPKRRVRKKPRRK